MSETALRRAKRPRSIIAGPYGHPFHAILITIPIGGWTSSVIFDIVALTTGDDAFVTGALWLIAIGTLGGIVAAAVGFFDWSVLEKGTKARKTATLHMILNLGAIALFTISFFVRLGAGTDDFSVAGFVLSLIGIAAVGASGFLGGELAYRHGVRVADESTQLKAFE